MRIVIITANDTLWALPTWKKSIKHLKNAGHIIVGLWTCPQKLGNLTASNIPIWYLQTFGFFNFLLLSVCALFLKLKNITSGAISFKNLALKNKIYFNKCDSPNSDKFIKWIKKHQIDLVVIMVDHIIEEKLLNVPDLNIINKHAALLPANRGLFPYFWAKLNRSSQGVSFHRVVKKIDDGNLLLQQKINDEQIKSMVNFYITIFRSYPSMLIEAIANLEKRVIIAPYKDVTSSYHSLPSKQDVQQFYATGGKIILWRDILEVFYL